jgi:hypothetical protein
VVRGEDDSFKTVIFEIGGCYGYHKIGSIGSHAIKHRTRLFWLFKIWKHSAMYNIVMEGSCFVYSILKLGDEYYGYLTTSPKASVEDIHKIYCKYVDIIKKDIVQILSRRLD